MAENKIPKLYTTSIAQPLGGWTQQQYGVVPVEGEVNPATGISNQYSQSTNISLHRANFKGHIAPGETFTKIDDTAHTYLSNLPLSGMSTTDSTNTFFSVLADTNLVAFNATQTLAQYTITNGTGLHSSGAALLTSNNYDVLRILDTTGSEYVLWSWADVNRGMISIMKTSGANPYNSWYADLSGSGVLNKNVPMMLAQGADGNIYCTNGQYIAAAVGNNTDILSLVGNPTALNLGLGWQAQSMTNYGNYLAIVAQRASPSTISGVANQGRSKVFLWITNGSGTPLNPAMTYEVNDFSATNIITKDGVLYIISNGADRKTRIKYLSPYNKFENAFSYDKNVIGDSPLPRSVDVCRDMLVWAPTTKHILNTLDGSSFHQEMNPNDGAGIPTTVGMVRNLDPNGLYIGVQRSGTYQIMQINESSWETSAQWFSNLIRIPYKSTIRKVKVYFSQFSKNNSSVQVSLMKNYNGGGFGGGNDLLLATVSSANFPNVDTDLSASIIKTIPDVSAFYIGLNFNHATLTTVAAVVRSIEIEYETASNP